MRGWLRRYARTIFNVVGLPTAALIVWFLCDFFVGSGPIGQIVTWAVRISLGIGIGLWLLFRFGIRFWQELWLLNEHYAQLNSVLVSRPATRAALRVVRARWSLDLARLRQIVASSGLDFPPAHLADITKAAFQQCRGTYIGGDRHVPSEFRAIYPTYLDDQVERPGFPFAQDVRFLIVDKASLLDDFDNDAFEFRRFYDFHWERGIELLQIDPSKAEVARHKAGLPSVEFGLYGSEYMIFFRPRAGRDVNVQLVAVRGELRRSCEQFLDELASYARLVRFSPNGRPVLKPQSHETTSNITSRLAAWGKDRAVVQFPIWQ